MTSCGVQFGVLTILSELLAMRGMQRMLLTVVSRALISEAMRSGTSLVNLVRVAMLTLSAMSAAMTMATSVAIVLDIISLDSILVHAVVEVSLIVLITVAIEHVLVVVWFK